MARDDNGASGPLLKNGGLLTMWSYESVKFVDDAHLIDVLHDEDVEDLVDAVLHDAFPLFRWQREVRLEPFRYDVQFVF